MPPSAALMLSMSSSKGGSETLVKQVAGVSDPHELEVYRKLHDSLIGKSKEGTKLATANRIFSRLGWILEIPTRRILLARLMVRLNCWISLAIPSDRKAR